MLPGGAGMGRRGRPRSVYIIRVAEDTIGAIGRKWVATHAPRGSSYLEVTALIPGGGVLAFGSNDEDITTGGGHEWHW